MAAISQTTFSNAFSCMKMFGIRFRFHWIWVTRVQLTILQHWFIWWLGVGQATSHYLNQWWSALLTHVCVTRPQWPERHIVHTNTLIYVFVNNKILTSEQNMVRGCKCLWNLSDSVLYSANRPFGRNGDNNWCTVVVGVCYIINMGCSLSTMQRVSLG